MSFWIRIENGGLTQFFPEVVFKDVLILCCGKAFKFLRIWEGSLGDDGDSGVKEVLTHRESGRDKHLAFIRSHAQKGRCSRKIVMKV